METYLLPAISQNFDCLAYCFGELIAPIVPICIIKLIAIGAHDSIYHHTPKLILVGTIWVVIKSGMELNRAHFEQKVTFCLVVIFIAVDFYINK